MFPSSIHHYIIWSDKCYLLVHKIVELHLLEISMNCRWVHQPPPHPLLGLMMNSWFGICFHSSFPENLATPSCQIVLHPFLLRHHESEVSWHQSDLNLGQIRWLEHIPKSYNKVMSCLAHLAGGPAVIASFLASLTILPWGNCKTYSTSCSWWILRVSKVWSSPDDHVNAISKHVCGTSIFDQKIWSTMLKFLY